MKTYLKILLQTITIQIVAILLGFVLKIVTERGYYAFVASLMIGYVISLVTDIFMAVKSGDVWYKKLGYIVLMPTNYTPIGLLWFAMYCFAKFFEMLPDNLG